MTGWNKTDDSFDGTSPKDYQILIDQYYPRDTADLGGFSTYYRYAGPREAVFTAICHQNFGCSHFIVGNGHTHMEDFYDPDGPKQLFDNIGDIGIEAVFLENVDLA